MTPADYERLLERLIDTSQDVVFFPVRHHSPVCASMVAELIRLTKPAAVLIEGPSDFNPHLNELLLDHSLPIAIYSYFRVGQGHGSGAYYPFCEYSPEWIAMRAAREVGAEYAFIDLPWIETAPLDRTEHRYADAEMRHGKYIAALCSRLQVDDFNELWDRLVESDLELDLGEFLSRVHGFCLNTRLDDISVSRADAVREAFMASEIRRHQQRLIDQQVTGPIVVVTGGYHCAALAASLFDFDLPQRIAEPNPCATNASKDDADAKGDTNADSDAEAEADVVTDANSDSDTNANADANADVNADVNAGDPTATSEPGSTDAKPPELERGLALTTYSYQQLDSLTGYNAGMPNPGFYEHAWRSRSEGEGFSHRPLLAELASQLRLRKQTVSTADLVAVETAATGLAAMRGRNQIWRSDLIDAVISALVKDETHYERSSPFLDAVHAVLRGSRRGVLDSGTTMPPLVHDIRRQLQEHGLTLGAAPVAIHLELSDAQGIETSRLLHRLRLLQIKGVKLQEGTDFLSRSDMARLWEQWELCWMHNYESSCIEAARYGTNLLDATTRRLHEILQTGGLTAANAAALIMDASRAGIESLSDSLLEQLRSLIAHESDFAHATEALGHLTYLYCYDETLGTQRSHSLAELLAECYTRSVWLMDALGGTLPGEKEALRGMQVLQEVAQRAAHVLQENRDDQQRIFTRVQDDVGKHALVRGAASGILWNLGVADPDSILARLFSFADPNELGNYLTGLFALAREMAQRQPRLVQTIDRLLMEYPSQRFQEALPSLRLAFTYFTPREKHYMLSTLFESLGIKEVIALPKLTLEPEQMAEAMVIEEGIFEAIKTYGLGGGDE